MGILAVMGTDIMYVFDVILILYGGYTIYSAFQMKKTGMLGKWLVNEQEGEQCRDKKGFIDAIFSKTIIFGCFVLVYGLVSILNRTLLHVKILDIASLIVFLAVCILYVLQLKRARKKFF